MEWKERFMEFENNFWEVLGDFNGMCFLFFKVGISYIMR